jgi:PAS domain S-box-containing protein
MNPERILVVDDDEALLNLITLSLRRRGYAVESACNGLNALEVLRTQPPFAVMLTDLMMPGMTGLELLREARKLDAAMQIVVVTAAPGLESAIASMRADGAYDYLLKPFESMSQLLMAVERASAHRRLLQEREALRDQVQNEAERLRALITNTGDAIFSARADGVLCIVNPAAAALVGRDDLEGKVAAQVLPSALSVLIANWRVVSGTLPAVVEMNWPDGTVQMVRLTPIPEGDQYGWVAVLRDITHVKHMEELKSQLLVEAASRIRLPLSQAMNALMELNLITAKDAHASEVTGRLTQIWKRIQEWGDDLNALLRIDSGIALQDISINLAEVLEEAARGQAGAAAQNAEVRLELHLPEALPQVTADPELVRRLLDGLILRAISRSARQGAIWLTARTHADQVLVSVHDEGPAVTDAELPALFERTFVRTGAAQGITGLEMALVKSIIDRMGGQVWAGGDTGENVSCGAPTSGALGSVITICLPAARPNTGAEQGAPH